MLYVPSCQNSIQIAAQVQIMKSNNTNVAYRITGKELCMFQFFFNSTFPLILVRQPEVFKIMSKCGKVSLDLR